VADVRVHPEKAGAVFMLIGNWCGRPWRLVILKVGLRHGLGIVRAKVKMDLGCISQGKPVGLKVGRSSPNRLDLD
jgi:hypothetical protein